MHIFKRCEYKQNVIIYAERVNKLENFKVRGCYRKMGIFYNILHFCFYLRAKHIFLLIPRTKLCCCDYRSVVLSVSISIFSILYHTL